MNTKNRKHLVLGQTKYCKLCKITRPSDGGYWVEINEGKNRVWLCAKHRTQK